MKKILSLFLSALFLVTTTSCRHARETPTTSIELTASVSSTSKPTEFTDYSQLGMPSWLYHANYFPNGTHGIAGENVVVFPTAGGLYAYEYNSSETTEAQVLTKLTTSETEEADYASLNHSGLSIYAGTSLQESQSTSEKISIDFAPLLEFTDTISPTYQIVGNDDANPYAPVFIEENIYYLLSGENQSSIQKIDPTSGEVTTFFSQTDLPISSFVYDNNYIYFQSVGTSSDRAMGQEKELFSKVYRLSLTDPTNVESFELGGLYQLEFVHNGALYLFNTQYNSGKTSGPSQYARCIWGESPSDFLSSIQNGQSLKSFEPYLDGFAVLSMDEEQVSYLSFYDYSGHFSYEITSPVESLNEDGFSQTLSFESYGDSLLYYTVVMKESMEGTTPVQNTVFISPQGQQIQIPEV